MKPRLLLIVLLGATCALARTAAATPVGDISGPAMDQLKDAADRDADGSEQFDGNAERGRGRDGDWHRGDRGDGDRDGDRDGHRRRRDGDEDRHYPRPHGRSTHVNEPPAPHESWTNKASKLLIGGKDKNTMEGMLITGASFGALIGALTMGPLGILLGGLVGLGASYGLFRFF